MLLFFGGVLVGILGTLFVEFVVALSSVDIG